MSLLEFHQSMQLGRKAVKRDSRTPFLRSFLSAGAPPPPVSRTWSKGVLNWGVKCNDRFGCCTISGAGSAVQVWELNTTGKLVFLDDKTILQYYGLWDGYSPLVPGSDQGGIELDVLTQWKTQGFASNPLTGFIGVQPTNGLHVRQGINYFGGLYIGLALPDTAQGQTEWAAGSAPGSWGNHCVYVVDYDEQGLTCITWGTLQRMTWGFFTMYCDEAWALLSPDFLTNGTNPIGLDVSTLLTYLEAIQ